MHNVNFEVLPSHFLRNSHWIISGFVALIILILPLTPGVKLSFLSLIFLSAIIAFNMKSTWIVTHVKHEQADRWYLLTQEEKFAARLLKRNFICDFFVILRFEIEAGAASESRDIFLLKHQLHLEDWCRLHQWLRLGS